MTALLLASVLTTCAGQALYALIALKNGWYSAPARYAVCVLCLASSVGGLWFVFAGLTGGETLLPALVFAGCQALAVTLVVGSGLRGIVRDGNLERDTNIRIKEIQERGQHDRPEERTDRLEGHEHRSDIDARLRADTEKRSQERQDEREERAETRSQERQDDREERAEERREDREERADERRDE